MMKKKTHSNATRITLCLCYMLISSAIGSAGIIHVPADQPTIQDGINVAQTGDTVLVADGTYTGVNNVNLDLIGKAILVSSEHGAESCIIDCQGSGRGFYFHGNETADSVVRGFTIKRGRMNSGGGVYCTGASPRIDQCIIQRCTADSSGGGIALRNSNASITDCVIEFNHALDDLSASGSGIYTSGGLPLITGCTIRNNHISGTSYAAGGGICCANAIISNCIISGNEADSELVGGGGGIAAFGDNVRIYNCLFYDNYAALYGGGMDIENAGVSIHNCTFSENISEYTTGGAINCINATLNMVDCVLWDDDPSEIQYDQGYSSVFITFSDISGGFSGNGNIDQDPLFVPGNYGDYYLSNEAAGQALNSPCLDAGSDSASAVCYPVYQTECCIDTRTTRTDEVTDSSTVDLGYHYAVTGNPSTPTPVQTPTTCPTPTATQSISSPTLTPPNSSPTATPPVASPTPTVSPTVSFPELHLRMPSHTFHPGDTCGLQAELMNHYPEPMEHAILVVMLDLETGVYWFYPGWKQYPPTFDFDEITVSPGETDIDIIGTFQWPDTGVSEFSGAHFYGAILSHDFGTILSNLSVWDFGWGPADTGM